jgi:hypothetical protein
MHPILHKLTASRKAAGVELVGGAAEFCAHVTLVRRRGNKLDVEKTVLNITDADALKKLIPSGIPVVVVLSGKGILHRTVSSGSDDAAVLLQKVLPNATVADFCMQHIAAAQQQHLVSVMRRSAAEEQLDLLRRAGLPVVACSLGAAAAAEWMPMLWPQHPNTMQIGAHRITWLDGKPAALEPAEIAETQPDISLSGITLAAAAVPAFTAAAQYLSGGGNAFVQTDTLATAATDFAQQRLFRTGGLALLAATLLVLIANYFAFSHYWEKKAALEEQLQVSGNVLEQVRELGRQTEMRRSFLEQSGWKHAGKHAFFADRLAAGIPQAMTLTRMSIAPREKTPQPDSIAFRPGVILLEGECAQSVLLNDWITQLNTQPWINKASLLNYVQPGNRSTGLFEVEIQLGE